MKRLSILLIFSLSLFSFTAFASQFQIKLHHYANVMVFFDGQTYQHNGGTFTLSNVTPGMHHVKVYAYNRPGSYYNRSRRVIYNDRIHVPAATRVSVFIDRHNRVRVTRKNIVAVKPNPHARDYYGKSPKYGYNKYGTGTNHYHGKHYKNNYSVRAFEDLKYTVANARFESTRYEIASSYLIRNSIYAYQVAEIMELFNYESTRLKFAKKAYRSTIDKGNYFRVYDAFRFESSIRELNRYIYRR